jgi:hypothetical protein
VRLIDLLERAEALEQRAAALYRRFAASRCDDPELTALWTDMATEEEDHAQSVRQAREAIGVDNVSVEGCGDALADIAQRLRHAESLRADASPDRQLSAALDLELSELESLRLLMLQASRHVDGPEAQHRHLQRLADVAMHRSEDGHVRLGAALLLARLRLAADAAARQTG